MFDILMFLFESYFYTGSYPNSDKLSLKLTVAGFENEEINRALDWLSGLRQLNLDDYPATINCGATRCYSGLEIARISPDARRFLLFWEQQEMITPVEREMILDRAIALGREDLPLEKVKLITLIVLWNQNQELDPMIVEELITPVESSRLH